jgi:hypothetical protein
MISTLESTTIAVETGGASEMHGTSIEEHSVAIFNVIFQKRLLYFLSFRPVTMGVPNRRYPQLFFYNGR